MSRAERIAWETELIVCYTWGALGYPSAVTRFDADYRGYFLKLIRRGLHPRLRRLFDPQDLLQEFYQEIFVKSGCSLVVSWNYQLTVLRLVAQRTVSKKNRAYLDTGKRDLRRERHPAKLPERPCWDMAIL